MKISVIMPLYNAEQYVGESIESILGQTLGDFELIVVDDCSTDGSFAVTESHARRDPRIRLLRNEQNLGAAQTRNRALDVARGEYVAFMDADDLVVADRLAVQVDFLDHHPKVDLCGSYGTMFFPDGRRKLLKTPLTHEDIAAELLFGCPFGMPSVMMRREAFKRSGIRLETCMAEDYKLWADLSERMRMACIPRSLFLYRQWDEQISATQHDRQNESARAVQTEYIARRLGLDLSEAEAELLFRITRRIGPVTRDDVKAYRSLLERMYRANEHTRAFDRRALKKQLAHRYKKACKGCMSRAEARIRKTVFTLSL